jgi:hypothetical protein
MATTTKDFITRYGVLIQGSNSVTSSTGQTNALQVNGGIAVAKNIFVGTDADIYGDVRAKKSLNVSGSAQISGITTLSNGLNVVGLSTFSNYVTFNSGFVSNGESTFNGPITLAGGGSLSIGTGSLSLSGGLSVGGISTFTNSTAAATGAIGALVVSNGGIYVGNNLYIAGTGANTGTNTSNALYLAGGAWIDKTLVVEGQTVFKGDVTFSGSATYVLSTNTVYTDNIINLHTPPGGVDSAWTLDDGKDIGFVFHNYKGSDNDSFLGWANDNGYLEWYSNGLEVNGVFTGTSYGTFKTANVILVGNQSASSTTTGALQVVGGVSAGNIYSVNDVSGGSITARNLTQGRIVFAGVGGQLTDDAELTYDALTNLLSADVSKATTATNLAGGGPGMIPYQSDVGITAFVSTGTSGYVLSSNGTSAPTWEPLSGLSAGNAVTATNIAGGSANQIVIQTGAGATGFVGPGNAGQFLRSNGASNPPSYVNTGNIYVGFAVWADNLKGPANGIPYQAGTDLTQFIYPGANGTLLQSNGTTASFVSTTTLLVGYAENAYTADRWTNARTITFGGDLSGFVTINGSTNAIFTATVNSGGLANNLAGGTTGAIPYQSATSSTTFLTLSGTENSVLSAGTSAPKYVTQVQAKSGTGSSTTTTSQSLQVTDGGLGVVGDSYIFGNVGISSNLKISGSENSTSTNSGSLQVSGGVGVSKDLVVGGVITVGSSTNSSVIPALYSNNIVLASYTTPVLTNTNSVNLDQYDKNIYRTARYTAQIVDGGNIHITEIMLTHNGTNAYINEYGIITNNGELGIFTATIDTNNITLSFIPSSVTSMTIKVVRFGITA